MATYTYTCPTCGKTVDVESKRHAPLRPFCCERCKLLDLAKWFNEEYRVEVPLHANQRNAPSERPDAG